MEPRKKSLAAVVLAGGKGTRMHSDIPKACHSLAGKPLLAHALEPLKTLSLERTCVVVGWRAESVIAAITPYNFPALDFVVQEEQLGTAHATRCALARLAGFEGDILVRYGDTPCLSSKIFRELVRAHRAERAAATFLTAILPDGGAYGRIVRSGSGAVLGIVEARNAGDTERAIREVNVGAYCFDSRALARALDKVEKNSVNGEFYLTDTIRILAGAGERVATLTLKNNDEMHGINTQAELEEAEARLARSAAV